MTGPSVFIQENYAWVIPTIQSIHIVAIAVVVGSVFLIDLRVLGWAGSDQTLQQTVNRYGPWFKGALWVLLATGLLMVIGEPARELLTVSFWVKMFLVAVGTAIALIFWSKVNRHGIQWEESLMRQGSTKILAVATFLIWLAIVVLGRFIAYDQIWGSLSPSSTA